MIVFGIFLIVGEFSRYARGPDYQKLAFHIVVEELRCPGVDGGRIHSSSNETLGCPMNQVFRRTIAKALIPSPRTGPDKMKRTIRPFHNRWVTHYLLQAYFRTEKHALDGVPPHTVVAVDESQTFRSWLMK